MKIPLLRFCGLGSVLLAYGWSGSVYAAEPCVAVAGRLAAVEGLVEVQRTASAVWLPVALDAELCQGDTLRVGELSRAAVVLLNDAVLRLDQNTTIRLTAIAEDEEDASLLSLVLGAFQSFSRQPRELEVDTPYLNGAVEGTEFVFRVAENRTALTVIEGQVQASNAQGSRRVSPGETVAATAGTAPEPLLGIRPLEAVQWALYYPPVLALAATTTARTDSRDTLQTLAGVAETARDSRFYLQRAALLLNVGRVEEARADIERALALDATQGLALALQAVIAIAQNDTATALAAARQAVTLSPQAAAAKIALSYAEQADFQLPAARDTLLQAVAQQPQDPLAWARLAELQLMLGEREQALAAAARAVSLDPDLGRTQTTLGFVALAEFRAAQAHAAFERAIALDSANPLAHLGRGLALISAGELAAGRSEIEIAVGLDPNNALLRAYLGKAYFEETRSPLAADQFRIARDLDPLDPTAFLYDSIRQQTENQPVAALGDLQTSIALNDNRAVYRSRLLLDEDQAARGTSLARIFSDLGFGQLGLNAAAESLTLDPGNASAHRFLSDSYRDSRRREIARVSELLQAQLLQDININPVQPSLSETNLNIVTLGGPASPGFNEFTPLFQRNETRFDVSGFAGNNATYGGEAVVTGLYDGYSLSAGVFAYDTDGFRRNNDLHHDIYNVFAQAAVTPDINVQAELRRRESASGDLVLNFDPDVFFADLSREFDENSARFGLRWSPDPATDLLVSVIYSDRQEDGQVTQPLVFPDGTLADLFTRTRTEEDAYQIEGQYLWRGDSLTLVAGAAYARVEQELGIEQSLVGLIDFPPFTDEPTSEDYRGYVYGTVHLPEPLVWTFGLSYQQYEEDAIDFDRLNPKLGLTWDITAALQLRAAYAEVVKPALAGNRTLEPTQIAGFNQLFDDANATRSTRYGIGIDWQPHERLYLGGELSRRQLEQPVFIGDEALFEDRDEWLHRAYAYWTPTARWGLSLETIYDRYESPDDAINPDLPREVRTVSVPLRAQYFHPSGWFGGVGVTYVEQTLRRSELSLLPEGDSEFAVVDLAVGYRFQHRRGSASLAVQNLFDETFDYQDDSFREFQDEPATGPYSPERTLLGRITLSF